MLADYAATNEELPQTPIARWDANIAAPRLLNLLQAEGREVTPVEQAVLAQYSGFGDSDYEQGFNPYTSEPAWKERRDTLQSLVTGEEYDAIKRSRLNAFYTTPTVVKTMWSGVEGMGAGNLPRLRILNQSQGEMRRWWGSYDGAGAFSKYGPQGFTGATQLMIIAT